MTRRLRLGIDTGGTFTDAALVDEESEVIAFAKSPTTHQNLVEGILGALEMLLGDGRHPVDSIAVVSLSTTLATNAMVEQTGTGAAAILVGFDDAAVGRIDGLPRAVAVGRVDGGHDAHGKEVQPLDLLQLAFTLDEIAEAGAEAIAVASMFAVRNQDHEVRVRDIVASHPELTGIPVTCTHDLSGRLNGPRRAATALANSLLTGPVRHLLDAFEVGVRHFGVGAPLVVVRSDGSVMSLSQARERPVETILSGPAASLIGGMALSGVSDAVVVDIGGTTTDVGIVTDRVPILVDDGAVVGGTATMVRSPLITTVGLGGDSEVSWDEGGSRLGLGPGRLVPICVGAAAFPQIPELLGLQSVRRPLVDTDALFYVDSDGALREASKDFPTRREFLGARRQASIGRGYFIGLTPTDAAVFARPDHVEALGFPVVADAARLGLVVFGRCHTRFGSERFPGPEETANAILCEVYERTGAVIARAVGLEPSVWAATRLNGESPLVRIGATLDRPIVGIGASAFLYHPPVGEMFSATAIIPTSSEVANAVGAAIGSVRLRDIAVITQPKRSGFVVHRPGQPVSFDDLDDAVAEAERRLKVALTERHATSGLSIEGGIPKVELERTDKIVEVAGANFFVECRVEATLVIEPGAS